jgi:hypothetical protein
MNLINLLTGEIITDCTTTTDSPDSSYGIPCVVDKEGNSYGQLPFLDGSMPVRNPFYAVIAQETEPM